MRQGEQGQLLLLLLLGAFAVNLCRTVVSLSRRATTAELADRYQRGLRPLQRPDGRCRASLDGSATHAGHGAVGSLVNCGSG